MFKYGNDPEIAKLFRHIVFMSLWNYYYYCVGRVFYFFCCESCVVRIELHMDP